MAAYTLGNPINAFNSTPSAGTYNGNATDVASPSGGGFQADFIKGPFMSANVPADCSFGFQRRTSTSDPFTTVWTQTAGQPNETAFPPITLMNTHDIRFFYTTSGSVPVIFSATSVPRIYVSGVTLHNPTITITSPGATVGTNLRPNIDWTVNDQHPIIDWLFTIKQGSTILVSGSPATLANSYTYDEVFGSGAADLPRGASLTLEAYAMCEYGRETTVTKNFTTAASATSVTINQPSSGGLDLTPNLQAFVSNNYGETVSATAWAITGYGTTSPGVNAGIGASFLEYANDANWATYTPLTYGNSYTVTLTVTMSDGTTANANKHFSIAAYEPTAVLTSPLTKINTLTPTISGTFTSAQGFGKDGHEFIIMSPTNRTNIIGKKTVSTGDSNTPFSSVYTNDGSWTPYTPLQWDTTYIFAVRVKDDQGNWSTTSPAKASEKSVKTNSYPTPPTNMLPTNGGYVTTRQPQLSAQFNDPDTEDTPTNMEVEVVGVTVPSFTFTRTESDGNEVFSVLLSDSLVIGHTYAWRTRFTDNGGLVGSWSNWSSFEVREGVETTITNPSNLEVFTTPVQTFTWTYTHPSGVAQASGRLRIYNQTGSVPIYDSGTVAGAYLSQVIPTTLFQNNTVYRALVTVTDANGDTASSGYVYFSTSWVGPSQPTDLTLQAFDIDGYVRLTWSPSVSGNFVAYRLYRRDTSVAGSQFVMIDDIRDRLATSYDYYFAPSGIEYEYAVTLVSNETGADIESNITLFETATLTFPNDTWLNEEYDPASYRVKLRFNPTRSLSYARESAMLSPLGRTRPVVHYGNVISRSIQTSFMIYLPFSEIVTIEHIIQRARPVLYRDGRGRKVWVALLGYNLQDMTANRGTIQLELREISVVDR